MTISRKTREGGSAEQLRRIDRESMQPYFGELSLIERIPVTATVTATSDCMLLHLSPIAFRNFLNIVPDSVKTNLREAIQNRARHGLSHKVADVVDASHVGLTSDLKTSD